jgi:hypothetical protein
MDEKIFQLSKILKKYTNQDGFEEFFKNLSRILFPFRKRIEKKHIKKILNNKIPVELALDEQFANLYEIIQRYKEFDMWPVHIYDLILLLIDIFEHSDSFESIFNPLMDLLKKLLIF